MSEKGAPLGVATLDMESKIPSAMIPDLSATILDKLETAATDPSGVLPATYAKLPGPSRNALTGDYRADGYGAVGDTTTDNTPFLQEMIDAAIAAGGGTVHIPYIPGTSGVYRFSQLTIAGKGNIDLTIEAAPGVVLRPAPLLTTDCIVISSGSTSTTDGTFLRRLTLRNLVIQGQLHWNSGTKIPRRGIVVSQAQDIKFENVKLSQFQKGALVMTDVFDSYFNDVEIKWSGYGAGASNYAHAVQFLGSLDNCNNNRFTNLHLEFCPLEILFDNNARQNSFVNTKFEHGGETEVNASGLSPVWFKQSIETMFTGGYFTEDDTMDTPRIHTDDNANSYLTTYNVRQAAKFSNFLLFANSLNKARWFSGYNTDFQNVTVQRANGAAGGYGFDFFSRNSFRNGTITMADNGSNFFRFQGDNNVVEGNTLVTFGDGAGANTAVYLLSSGATRNLIQNNAITGSVGTVIAAGAAFRTAGTFGTNVIVHERDHEVVTSGGGTKNVFHKALMKLTDSIAVTYTSLVNGYTGQTIVIFATTANSTLQHGTTANAMALKSGANKTLAANETIILMNIEGVWREI